MFVWIVFQIRYDSVFIVQ